MDAWACREGTPEDDEDARNRVDHHDGRDEDVRCDRGRCRDGGGGGGNSGGIHLGRSSDEVPRLRSGLQPGMPKSGPDNGDSWTGYEHESDVANEWVELDVRLPTDEEIGQSDGRNHRAS